MDERKRSLRIQAQHLRRNATKQENRLWYEFLRTYPVQFRRQMVIDRFIVDFYCASAKIAIEVDGAQHFEADGIARDRERTEYLNGLGIQVLRFTNREVERNFQGVCQRIASAVNR